MLKLVMTNLISGDITGKELQDKLNPEYAAFSLIAKGLNMR